MRRFSQRNSLVTLSDINITPLLDLAFVLLIIFVIISPSIRSQHETGMNLKLPEGGGAQREIDVRDLRLVEISPKGEYMLDRRPYGTGKAAADRVVGELAAARRLNPNLVVKVRADQQVPYMHVSAIIDGCQQNQITDFSLATERVSAR
jgi:biopolymer transport protein ExbD